MSSIKWIFALIIVIAVIAFYAYVESKFTDPTQPTTLISDQNPPFNLRPQVDKTDIFAIPYDLSEEEGDDELEELEDYSKTHASPNAK